MERKTADIGLIMAAIPHRYPFLMVDRVIDIDGYVSGTGVKNVSINEPFFQGHFPENPIMPGLLIVESMAQTAGVIAAVGTNSVGAKGRHFLLSVDKCRMKSPVVPGDQLMIHIKTLRGALGVKMWTFEGRAEVLGKVACEAQFTTFMDVEFA